MIFSNIHFGDLRQVILLLLAMNHGLRILDVIAILSVVIQSCKFRPNRNKEVNDFQQMLKQLQDGALVVPDFSH